ncbi:MAG TPA: hypothetical protein DIU07_07410 [Rhodobacteraceae bacterium]|nr:hypothetical protein [Paracoccaceae bacterium]
MSPLGACLMGTSEYPDRSATLKSVETALSLSPEGPRLTRPGIETLARLDLPEIAAFCANRALFLLGLCFFFTAGDRVAALARRTPVEDA